MRDSAVSNETNEHEEFFVYMLFWLPDKGVSFFALKYIFAAFLPSTCSLNIVKGSKNFVCFRMFLAFNRSI